jgi:hypothetical protein
MRKITRSRLNHPINISILTSIDCDHTWPMAEPRQLFDEILEAVDSLLLGVSVKPSMIDSLRGQARDRISLLRDCHNRKVAPTALVFARELAGMANLCTRLYRGVKVGNDFSKERKAECANSILKFFVYFQYPIDLRDTEPNFDESFLEPPWPPDPPRT